MSNGVSFTLQQDSQKSGGAIPHQSKKWRGHCPPASLLYENYKLK